MAAPPDAPAGLAREPAWRTLVRVAVVTVAASAVVASVGAVWFYSDRGPAAFWRAWGVMAAVFLPVGFVFGAVAHAVWAGRARRP